MRPSPAPSQSAVPVSSQHKRRWPWIVAIIVLILVLVGGGYFYFLVRQNIASLESDTTQSKTLATTDDPYKGPDDAAIIVVEFADFQCPYCRQSFPVVREIISQYEDRVKFIYRDFPLTSLHSQAQIAAEAGECAHEQDMFWPMHDKMFINQDDLSLNALQRYAREIEIPDPIQFNTCLTSRKYETEVNKDFSDGYFAGVDGTPTFFINGQEFTGAVSVENFKTVLDELISIYGQGS